MNAFDNADEIMGAAVERGYLPQEIKRSDDGKLYRSVRAYSGTIFP